MKANKQRFKQVATVALMLLFYMKLIASQVDSPPVVVLQWTNFVGETYRYSVAPVKDDALRVVLEDKERGVFCVTNHFEGGISKFQMLARRAMAEISTNTTKIPVGKQRCELSLMIKAPSTEDRASLTGDLKPLLVFSMTIPALYELLQFVSQDLPKMYRLAHRGGPLDQGYYPPVKGKVTGQKQRGQSQKAE